MSSPSSTDLTALPATVALDARTVLDEHRRGASLQIDGAYLGGQVAAIESIEDSQPLAKRRQIAARSREILDGVQVEFDAVTERTLRTASTKLRSVLDSLPEVRFLQDRFPGECRAVPEWLRTGNRVRWGARLYFFRPADAPEPAAILEENIDAVLADDHEDFDRYQGELHGYPECCVDSYASHKRDGNTAPEPRAVEPITDALAALRDRSTDGMSIEALVEGLFDTPDAYAYFTREFFPEPGCDRARQLGQAVYEDLSTVVPDSLVRDYFRLNAGWSYLMAQSVKSASGQSSRPRPGSLGREQLLLSLPLSWVRSSGNYRDD